MGPIDMLVVHPGSWAEVSEADRAEYQAAAEARGISVEVAGSARDELVVIRKAGDRSSRSLDVGIYNGVIRCRRLAWEHELRRLLGRSDPCFPA